MLFIQDLCALMPFPLLPSHWVVYPITLSTNDDIISALQIDDMVMYNGQRYRWKGTSVEYGRLCMVIEQDGKGKNGKMIRLPSSGEK